MVVCSHLQHKHLWSLRALTNSSRLHIYGSTWMIKIIWTLNENNSQNGFVMNVQEGRMFETTIKIKMKPSMGLSNP